MDLKDFKKVNLTDEKEEPKSQQTTSASDEIVASFLSNFGKLGEEELLLKMKEVVEKQKNNGTFDKDAMQNLVRKIGPFLSGEQKQKIDSIFGLDD